MTQVVSDGLQFVFSFHCIPSESRGDWKNKLMLHFHHLVEWCILPEYMPDPHLLLQLEKIAFPV